MDTVCRCRQCRQPLEEWEAGFCEGCGGVLKSDAGWVYAKIGTVPMMVKFDGRCKIEVGKRVRWREMKRGKWMTGIVTNIDPLRIDRF